MTQTVLIKPGQSLYQLAKDYLGNASYWRELALYNNINIFENPAPNTLLNIPVIEEVIQIQQALVNPVSNLTELATSTLSRTLPSNISQEVLDLSSVKQPNSGDYSLISWIV